jgi:CBS domain containing-hemolysin-like protein
LDTDSSLLPSALVFTAFLFLFSYLTLTERSIANSNDYLNRSPYSGLRFSFLLFKYACVIATALSGLALAQSIQPLGWWPITILSLALLVTLAVIDRFITNSAARNPALSRKLSQPLFRLVSRRPEPRPASTGGAPSSNGTNSNQNSGSGNLELDHPLITPEELVSMDERDRQMLRSILRLDVSTAREIMVPRLDMIIVEANSTLGEAASLMGQNGHSRLPVYEESPDNIVGVVHSRDLLTLFAQGQGDTPLRQAMRSAYFIPETKRLDDLLVELQEKAIQIAIVVDEYGGTEGLVTMEDLLEEIVGEIEDEFSRSEEPEVVHLPNGSALVDASVTTENVEDLFDTRLADSSDVDTLGGYIYRTLGRIPQTGDIVYTDNLRIEVVSTLGRRLRKLRIDRIARQAATSQAVN